MKITFLLPDIYTSKENNVEPKFVLGSKGRMDVAYFQIINFGIGLPGKKSASPDGNKLS